MTWTGNTGTGTSGVRGYERAHTVEIEGKPTIAGSSDPAFRGDPARHNPEDLLLASLSACHMLWFLGLCAEAGVVVTGYTDQAEGTMEVGADDGGRFTEVMLHPVVILAEGADASGLEGLHHTAHGRCFIANSVNFPVRHQATVRRLP